MRKRIVLMGPFILMFLQSLIPNVVAQLDYSNYLYSLDMVSYVDPVTAGGVGSVKVEVGANKDVNVHVEFKGHFSWGEWTFSSVVIPVGAGVQTVTGEVSVPYKTLIEPASHFYYYVYVALRGESWSPKAWGLVQTVDVIPASEVSHEELVALMSNLKWRVHTSSLSGGIKSSLFSKLEAAGWKIDSAYASGNMGKLKWAIGLLKAFLNELDSSNEASSYPDSELWEEQAEFIIERIELAIAQFP